MTVKFNIFLNSTLNEFLSWKILKNLIESLKFTWTIFLHPDPPPPTSPRPNALRLHLLSTKTQKHTEPDSSAVLDNRRIMRFSQSYSRFSPLSSFFLVLPGLSDFFLCETKRDKLEVDHDCDTQPKIIISLCDSPKRTSAVLTSSCPHFFWQRRAASARDQLCFNFFFCFHFPVRRHTKFLSVLCFRAQIVKLLLRNSDCGRSEKLHNYSGGVIAAPLAPGKWPAFCRKKWKKKIGSELDRQNTDENRNISRLGCGFIFFFAAPRLCCCEWTIVV